VKDNTCIALRISTNVLVCFHREINSKLWKDHLGTRAKFVEIIFLSLCMNFMPVDNRGQFQFMECGTKLEFCCSCWSTGLRPWSISMMVPTSESASQLWSHDVGRGCRLGVVTKSRGRLSPVALWRSLGSAAASTVVPTLLMGPRNSMTKLTLPRRLL